MEIKKQKVLLEYLISSPDTFALTSPIIEPSYFDPEVRNAAKFILDYYEEYNHTPKPEQIEAETNVSLTPRDVTNDQLEYCANEIETFCKRKAIEHAVLKSPELLEKGDYGKIEEVIKDAVTVSLNRDIGLRYFDDPAERLRKIAQEDAKISTGYAKLDMHLNGGTSPGEMLLFSANSGGGKSMTLSNLAVNYLEQGLDVVYFTFELSEYLVSRRFDSMITGFGQVHWENKIDDIAMSIDDAAPNLGDLTIKYFPSGTCTNTLKAFLKEYELLTGKLPGVIVADYLDIMGPNENMSMDNVFEKDKKTSEQFRDMCIEYRAIPISASQQNRDAVNAAHIDQSHIAGGISKINTTDNHISIVFTDAMRANGEISFHLIKTRNSDGVGEMVPLEWDSTSLRITDPTNQTPKLDINKVKNQKTDENQLGEEPSGSSLLNFTENL